MKVLGIIAEYNPFHNGHLYHLQKCRSEAEADFVVAVMSGNFTQRGEAAVMDKWARSRAAVECGIDLVLELPFAYAVNSAEFFAKGGIGILQGLGCVTHLGFGAEAGNLNSLMSIAEAHWEEDRALKHFLRTGISYAKAKEEWLKERLGAEMAALAITPNNILALEYLKQLKKTGSTIIPVMVNRKGPGYLDPEPADRFASATAIRNHLGEAEREVYMPAPAVRLLREAPHADKQRYFDLIRTVILRSSTKELSKICSVSEGLENRIKSMVRTTGSLEELIACISSKRYPKTRISRILCQTVMGLGDFQDAYYARVLAAGTKGMQLLRQIKKTAEISVITNINKQNVLPPLLQYDMLASDIYHVLTGENLYHTCDRVVHPYIRPQE